MSNTLLLRLAAPLQSWGVDSKFNRRGTQRAPTKSGVVGLVASALGRRRNESIEDLQSLRFGVRVDRPGILIQDFHMAHEKDFWKKQDGKYVHMTTRYYLADAVFVAALEGDEDLLRQIDYALNNTIFPLFLGRRSCPPEGKISLGIRKQKSILEALQEEPWQVSSWSRKREDPQAQIYITVEVDPHCANGYFQRDSPISFNQRHRKYGFRRLSKPIPVHINNPDVEHDPMQELMEV